MSVKDLVFMSRNDYPSTRIRAKQIADKLGAKFNEFSFDASGLVLVKCFPSDIDVIYGEVPIFIDLVDSDNSLSLIAKYPDIKVIAISENAKKYINARITNKVIVIPEHHCNFDNEVRTRTEVTTVGYVGSVHCFDTDVNELEKRFNEHGLEFKWLFCDGLSITRQDIVDFYMSIDIQVCYRLPRIIDSMPPELKNPLKLINAGSFKIPTVAYPELNYVEEFRGGFLKAKNVTDLIEGCFCLARNLGQYQHTANLMYEASKQHHIDNIVELYNGLVE